VHQDEIMGTTVTRDDDVYAAMHLADVSGERPGKRGKRRFPAFEVPPDAPIIPASRVQRVINEEGYF